VLVVVAGADSPLLAHFGSCRLMARVDCPYCGPELRERPIFVCRGPDRPLEALWAVLRQFV